MITRKIRAMICLHGIKLLVFNKRMAMKLEASFSLTNINDSVKVIQLPLSKSIICGSQAPRSVWIIVIKYLQRGKGVFINTLVGWAGQLKIFTIKLFWPPFPSRQNFLNPPQQVLKTFLTPPLLDVWYQFLYSTPIYLVCTICVTL